MEFPVEVPMKRPIDHEDTIYPALVFDEPDLALNIAVEAAGTPMEQTIVLLAGMAGVSREVILKMKESDFRTVTRLVLDPYQASFAEAGPGGNAPPAGEAGA